MLAWRPRRAQRGYITPALLGVIASRQRGTVFVHYALFGWGNTATSFDTSTEKYVFGSDTTAAGSAMSFGRDGAAASGDTNVGIFAGGFNGAQLASSRRYAWVSEVTANGSDLSPAGAYRYGASAGNGTSGVFFSSDSAGSGSQTSLYVFATDAVSLTTAIGLTSLLAAAGNATRAIFAGGFASVATTRKYTYSGATVVNGTALGTGRHDLAGAGNSTVGIFGGGVAAGLSSATTDRYTFSSDVVAAGGSLAVAGGGRAGAGNSTLAVFQRLAVTDKYTFSTDSVVAGTSLATARSYAAGCSSSPGNY